MKYTTTIEGMVVGRRINMVRFVELAEADREEVQVDCGRQLVQHSQTQLVQIPQLLSRMTERLILLG
jgi:hypothetical protein